MSETVGHLPGIGPMGTPLIPTQRGAMWGLFLRTLSNKLFESVATKEPLGCPSRARIIESITIFVILSRDHEFESWGCPSHLWEDKSAKLALLSGWEGWQQT